MLTTNQSDGNGAPQRLTLHLQFAARGAASPRVYEDFLMAIPLVLKQLARHSIDLEVLSYGRTAQTNLRLNLVVFPVSVDGMSLEQEQALKIWLRHLQLPSEDNPLHTAWRIFAGVVGNEKAPLYLHSFGMRPLDDTEPPCPQSGDPLNLTSTRWLPRGYYDGIA